MRTFGEMLKTARKNAQKTLGEVARHIGVSVSYLSDIELGHRAPPTDKIVKLSDFLGADAEVMLALAASKRGAFELAADQERPRAMQVAAALARRWDGLSEQELDNIEEILKRRRHVA